MLFNTILLFCLPPCLAALQAYPTSDSFFTTIPTPTSDATESATASPALPLNYAALPSPTRTATAAPLLIERCEGEGECTDFGSSETTLQASFVTSTIVQTTSVPCYITTYITDSQTITETVYSTEIITSTLTKEGTVFIIRYSPTPVLMSTAITSVMEITNTIWSYWLTSSGETWESTSSGGETIYGGGSSAHTEDNGNDNGWSSPLSSTSLSGWGTTSNGGWGDGGMSSGTATGTAWTHISNNNNNNAVYPTSSITASGWGTTTMGTNGVTANNGLANWNSGSKKMSPGWEMRITIFIACAFVLAWELCHFFVHV
ncbi:uncharacterized protein I303_106799 [Kwoniella dejecticola CBS 10117]|uniref:Uncharacterized protein n=1 Tax=Kwoniella dejecticola CBS 10117 TaxID=1296121 RepID=A0A1A5ZTM8_9TREE|nr:uncharacterized protein I303_08559 [Kwoniella dejecticola CBS 10117]OBR81174.1 hypothetical protein I303_08559 [Kwoniella dejecticola CBS 10117]